MKEILKTLLKYKFQILFVVILLIIQAYCDLSLPEYTSKIINIGIEKSGIENLNIEVIRESEYSKIKSYLTKEDAKKLEESYSYIEKNSEKYIKDYSILNYEGIYKLKENKTDLEEILKYPLLALNDNIQVTENQTGIEVIETLKNKYKTSPLVVEEKVINYIKKEYKAVGIDLNKLEMNYIYKTGGKMLSLALLAMVITILSVYISAKISAYFSRDLRKKLIEKIMSFESEEISDFKISSLITRSTNDIVQIQMLLTTLLRIVIFAPIIAMGAITKVSGSQMGYTIALSVLAILSLMLILFIVVVPKFKIFQELLDKLNQVSREILNGIFVIRAFTSEKKSEEKFEIENEKITKNGLFVSTALAIMAPTLTIIMNSISILILWVGGEKINAGTMEVGSLVALITYTMQIITAFLMVSMVAVMLPRSLVSIKRVSEVLNKDVKIKNKEKRYLLKNNKTHTIKFNNVNFKYPSGDADVLKNINFEAKTGETVAIIGGTGSGKTTLINLIPRFYDVTNGEILIDNINIKNINLKELRNIIGYVPQKGELFNSSILSNICFGLKNNDLEKAKEIAKISESLEFIEEKEDKFNYTLTENGTNISGGQRGRLKLARALIKDPQILILDDSMNALDYKTDANIRHNLKKYGKDKIIFIVAQRISSVMHADKIIVLNNGEIVGLGTNEELLKTCKIYKEIKISQLGGE